MSKRIALYFSWDRSAEATAPLEVLDNRFPALFEARRLLWPRLETVGDPQRFNQGIAGYLEHVFLQNFALFPQLAQQWTGNPVPVLHRRNAGELLLLDDQLLSRVDTLIIISFDAQRTRQEATVAEIMALTSFLDDPRHTVLVCPHHDIGHTDSMSTEARLQLQQQEHDHHGDPGIPPEQRFGGFALSLMAGLGMPIRNRFGLRPARQPDGSSAPFECAANDRGGILTGVSALNTHPHLPHFERLGDSTTCLEVLVRQRIDPAAPAHPFTQDGRSHFDAVLQSAPGVLRGSLIVTDATLWNANSGSPENLRRIWHNVSQDSEAGGL